MLCQQGTWRDHDEDNGQIRQVHYVVIVDYQSRPSYLIRLMVARLDAAIVILFHPTVHVHN
jgi:hypothetical protein